MFTAIARLAYRRPRRVVATGVAVAIAAAVLSGNVASHLYPFGADDPATDSVKAKHMLERASGIDPSVGMVALVNTGTGARTPKARDDVRRVARAIEGDRAVARVDSFYTTHDRAMVSRDGRSQYVSTHFKATTDKAQQDAAKRLQSTAGKLPGVKLGGFAAAASDVNHIVEHDLRRAELLAFPLLFLLSLLFFRSAVAALLPLLVGGMAIVGTFLILRVASELTDVSVFALNLTTGLGLGLAIDYSLFMVSRYREEIAKSGPGFEALQRTMATAGRTVLFSSLTVAAALASLLVFPQRFLYSMGLGGSLVALVAATVAVLVLPGVLALLGTRVNSLAPHWLQRAAERDARPAQAGAWYRLSRLVMRRPGPIAAASALFLIVAGLPFTGIKFNTVDATVLPVSSEARQVDIALKTQFPPHHSSPIYIAADARGSAPVRAYVKRLQRLPQAAAVQGPARAGRGTSQINVVPRHDVLDSRSEDLVRDIRAVPAPFRSYAGGQTAQFVDLKASISSHLPLVFAIVIVATLVVLFLMTGSVVLPIKALVMNFLTLSATFGILVFVFQDGRLEGLLDYKSSHALDVSMPVLLFAVAFGLATDYGVFLLSRIKEARDLGASDSESVAIGLERTGRIVTAAALLFSIAIGAFATSQIVFVKQNGVGTALAVLIDASIVRALLVPSLMELLGKWNWWAPKPLRRLWARVGLKEAHA